MGDVDEVDEGGPGGAPLAGGRGGATRQAAGRAAESAVGDDPAAGRAGDVPFEEAVVERDEAGRGRPSLFVAILSLVALVTLVVVSAAAVVAVFYVLLRLVDALA